MKSDFLVLWQKELPVITSLYCYFESSFTATLLQFISQKKSNEISANIYDKKSLRKYEWWICMHAPGYIH